MSTEIPAPLEHRFRLLLPFFFTGQADLSALRHDTGKKSWTCWEQTPAPNLYQDESLPNVREFLFGADKGSCRYWRVPADTANVWFKNGGFFADAYQAADSDANGRPATFNVQLGDCGIELFLSPHGCGVISLCWQGNGEHALNYWQECNYRVSQWREQTRYRFYLPYNPDYQTPPAEDAPFPQRLGQSGGGVDLVELVKFLLTPLDYQIMQEQFSVYSLTRFSHLDFSDSAIQHRLQASLSAFAHVEEFHHAGSVSLTQQVLNPQHWAAVGSLGACHLLADQLPLATGDNIPFNEQRLPIVLHKYFTAYLSALLQRVVLQQVLNRARNSLSGDDKINAQELSDLNEAVLKLMVNGYFIEISSREALNQYYQLAQRGLRVSDNLSIVQRALHDGEVTNNARYQQEMLHDTNQNMRVVAHVQGKLEWLEVLFASYYVTSLVHYVLGDAHSIEDVITKAESHWLLIVAAILSGLGAFWFLKPHKLKKH